MKQCNFCYLTLDECNCPSEMTPVRQSGKQYYEALINSNRRPKILATGEVTVNEHFAVDSHLTKEKEFQKGQYDHIVPLKLKYLGLTEGTRLKVTIEVLEDK